MKKNSLKLGLLASCFLLWNIPAYAASGDFTIYPSYTHEGNKSWIITEAVRGETVNESVTLENLSGKTQYISVFFREAIPRNENFIISEDTDFSDIGNWTTLTESSYTLTAGEKKKIPFEIIVPSDAAEGEYHGAVFAAIESPENDNLKVVTRIGVRVYLNVTEGSYGLASVLNGRGSDSMIFLVLSAMGVIGSLFYHTIIYKENRQNAKK